jgi:tRNA U34 2-thiouridine synthase MnmA/TrmU
MSGGVDSSVAAALLLEQGHDVTGVTLKLWGGESDSGCCSVADVEDARRVAAQLGVPHYVFNLTDTFDDAVVAPYVRDHSAGETPNPCVECNRSIKFGALFARRGAGLRRRRHRPPRPRHHRGRRVARVASRRRRSQGPVVRALHAEAA